MDDLTYDYQTHADMVMPVHLDNSLISQGFVPQTSPTTKRLISDYMSKLSPEYKSANKLYIAEKFYLERHLVDSLNPCR
jgi:hypothetical protein